MERPNAWKNYNKTEQKKLEDTAKEYKRFSDAGKTERECAAYAAEALEKSGYISLEKAIADEATERGKRSKLPCDLKSHGHRYGDAEHDDHHASVANGILDATGPHKHKSRNHQVQAGQKVEGQIAQQASMIAAMYVEVVQTVVEWVRGQSGEVKRKKRISAAKNGPLLPFGKCDI